ncbi:MAG TPA: winged helix DNA-binding domain-containing protein [Chitinophaga sp.]|uniref:winged helix DNA-binding domain-containing protein n=1 Tax=Chitinophaga sp. TaxID=1869181 RepID=UPI002B6A1A43|nr:winged helix DNA-binding domain-containing protein [Chitinophaga sp.]HVI47920.1 winged helix DNA-binding domain-containing protein [Chitinophaga sp.]
MTDILHQRLQQQHITGKKFGKAAEVVHWMGAVQAQDYAGAKWALGLRMKDTTDSAIDKAMAKGEIIRTHVLRPTWHFVSPADVRWMLRLSAPRISAAMAYNNRRLELDKPIFKKSNAVLQKALLGKKQLTRTELAVPLQEAGIRTDDIRITHLLVQAELEGLICSGPRKGKQFTYVLLEEHVPPAPVLTEEEALGTLALRYFNSHGPATVQDFSWWSGLSVTAAKAGLESVKGQLQSFVEDGATYWMPPAKAAKPEASPSIHFLPPFDEYTVAYKDRNIVQRHLSTKLAPMAVLSPVVIIDGQLAGTWKRTINKNDISLSVNFFKQTKKPNKAVLQAALQRYSDFNGLPVKLT